MPVNSFEDYPMNWKPNLVRKGLPIYKELAMQLEQDIKVGVLKPGMMLPPQRELADYLDINLSTVTRALKMCEEKGLICGAIGRGTFVASDATTSAILLWNAREHKLIEMGAIMPAIEENQMVIDTMAKLLKEPDAQGMFQYGLTATNVMQKSAALKWLADGNLIASQEQILFAAGGQNGLVGILASLFQRGDKIATNTLIYPGIKSVAGMLGIQLIPIQVEKEALLMDSLVQLCKNEEIKGMYLIPDYNNPTTVTMSQQTRERIGIIAKEYDIIVIEDGINSLLKENPLPPIATYAPEQTIYLSSVSKTISPGLRVAFLVSPPRFYEKLSIGLYNLNIMVAPLLIETVVRLIHSGKADEILKKRREKTKKRNQMVDEVLEGFTILGDEYCNFRWLMLPEEFTGRTFELCAKEAGVLVYGAERFVVGNSSVPQAVRIAITATTDDKDFEEGLYILKGLLTKQTEFTYF